MPNLKEILAKKLTKSQLGLLTRSFDIIGKIAIIEISAGLVKKRKVIADAIIKTHPNIDSVYEKASGRSGNLRLQKLKWVAGKKSTETICVENGIRLKLDAAKVYFSPRQANERLRILGKVKKNEKVLVMFSGAGPYVIEIAKFTSANSVTGVELNKTGHKYAVENAALNKVEKKAKFYCGDVRKVVPKLGKFDRIIMPLPKGAHEFLGLALKHAKKNAVINYYDFFPDEDIPKAVVERVKKIAGRRKVRILKVTKCGQLAPRAYRVCADIKVS